jgi:hypothetical protein
LDGYNSEEKKEKLVKEITKGQIKQRKEQQEIEKLTAREKGKLASDIRDAEEKEKQRLLLLGGPVTVNTKPEIKIKVTDRSLPIEMLTVYLFARSCLLHPYSGIFDTTIKNIKKSSETLKNGENKITKQSANAADNNPNDDALPIEIPDHIIINEKNYSCYVPIDRAIRVLQPIFAFLAEEGIFIKFIYLLNFINLFI